METIEQNVYTPAINFGKQGYEHYGAPRVLKTREYGQSQWERTLRPALDNAQAHVKTQYDNHGAPIVDRAWTVVEPYYQKGRENAFHIYNLQFLPAYATCQPYVESTYSGVRQFTLNTALPYAQSAWMSTVVLFDRTVWPQLRVLYGKNVEPQLFRIGERLGRYRDGKKLKAVVEDNDATSRLTAASSSLGSKSSSVSTAVISQTPDQSSTAAAETTDTASTKPKQDNEEVRQKIEDDLKNWQEKFAKAADKGSEDLEQRVKEIAKRQIQNQVSGVGEALFIQLEEAAKSEVRKLKNTIVQVVRALPEEPTSDDYTNAKENVSKATKQAGLSVKDKAQAIRDWKQGYDSETRSLVSAASQSTLEVMDNIRELGLQEIGMRWAWMEGVTYKDWSRYHSAKETFAEWREEVAAVATEHEDLQRASDAAMEIESKGMAIAEDTAEELRRLKQVGTWKIQSADTSDDFTTRVVPPVAAKQGQKVLEKASRVAAEVASSASSTVAGTESGYMEQANSKLAEASAQPNVESIVAAAKDKAQQVSGQANEAFGGTQKPARESLASEASKSISSASSVASQALPKTSTPISKSASSMASAASKKVYGGALAQVVGEQKPILDDLVDDDATYSDKMQSLVEEAGGRYADVTRAVSEALLKASSTQGRAESVTSVANEQYSKALTAASKALYGTEQGVVESMTSVAADRYSEAVAA